MAGCEEGGLGEGEEGPAEENATGGHGEAWLFALVFALHLRCGRAPRTSTGCACAVVARAEDHHRATLRDAVETMTLWNPGDGRDPGQAGTSGTGTQPPEGGLDIVILVVAHEEGADASVSAGYAESLEAQTSGMGFERGDAAALWPFERENLCLQACVAVSPWRVDKIVIWLTHVTQPCSYSAGFPAALLPGFVVNDKGCHGQPVYEVLFL